METSNPPIPVERPVLRHREYENVKRSITARDHNGLPTPTLIVGPPGGGKSFLVEQIAEELGVPFFEQVFSPVTTDTRIIGYNSAANGTYVPGIAYHWLKSANGGMLFVDEWDNGEPSSLVALNTIISGRSFLFPNGERLYKTWQHYIAAAANTVGTGAQNGFRRQSQDAAVRNRWGKITEFPYDEELERAVCQVPAWFEYVKKVRVAVGRLAKTTVYITPRESIILSAWLVNGKTEQEVMDSLFCELSPDARLQVIKEVGEFRLNPQSTDSLASIPTFTESQPYRRTRKLREYE